MNKLAIFVAALALCASLPTEQQQEVDLLQVSTNATPSGTYSGSHTVIGITVKVVMVFTGNIASVVFTGPIKISCNNEPWTLSRGNIVFTNDQKPGDCLHDALAQNKVQVIGNAYDSSANTITVKSKYMGREVDIELKPGKDIEAEAMATLLTEEFLGSGPSGSYAGSKSIVGSSVNIVVKIDSSSALDFTVTGPATVNCKNEAYSYSASNNNLNLPNLNKNGDCVHDTFAKYPASFGGLKYEPSANQIVASVKVFGVSFTIDLKSTSEAEAFVLVATSPAVEFAQFEKTFRSEAPLLALGDLSGKAFKGTKSVLGMTATAVLTFKAGTFDAVFTGSIPLTCRNEAYTLKGSTVDVTFLNKPGDCLHDAAEEQKTALKSLVYSSSSNSITAKVTYHGIGVTMVLNQVSEEMIFTADGEENPELYDEVVPSPPLPPAEMISRFSDLFENQAPSGKYSGSKNVAGFAVSVYVNVLNSNTASLKVIGPVNANCPSEKYTYSNGAITLDNLNKQGDCVHDAFANADATLQSISYDGSSDTITVKVKKIVNISIVLKKQ